MATTRPPVPAFQRGRLRGKMETMSASQGNNFGGVGSWYGGGRTGGNGDAPPPAYSQYNAPQMGYNMTPLVDYGMDAIKRRNTTDIRTWTSTGERTTNEFSTCARIRNTYCSNNILDYSYARRLPAGNR